jgi:hypothetical protein
MVRYFGQMSSALLILAPLATTATPIPASTDNTGDGWISLFNGRDLNGWDSWLGTPHKTVTGLDLKKDDNGEYRGVIGLNNDPKRVFAVLSIDGGPAIRISGEIYGALTTKEEYANYHFRCEFKWGKETWEPRKAARMDSGILYHCVGEQGKVGGVWMEALECQVMEQDCGDFYSIGRRVQVCVEGEQKDGKSPVQYKKGGAKHIVPSQGIGRIIRLKDNEKAKGEWNTMEVLCLGGTSIHVVNGLVEMVLTDIRHKDGDKEAPLTKGKIQLQSEGAEVFYRNIQIKAIASFPDKYKP